MSSNQEQSVLSEDDIPPAPTRPPAGNGLPVRRVRAEDSESDLPDDVEDLPEEPEDVPAGRGALMPIIVSAVAGLLVVGLLGAIMLAPQGKPGPAQQINLGGTPGTTQGQALPRPGYLAPDFNLPGLTGGQVQLSSFRSQKPVWVNFWATWCPPCRAEMPEMQKIYEKYKDQIEIVGVDVQEDSTQVSKFVKDGGFGWTFVLDGDANVSRNYYVSAIPTHLFIGRDGMIKDLVISGLNADSMEAQVSKLIAP